MADSKLTDLTQLNSPASGDFVYVVDISDSTDSASGSSRKCTVGQILELNHVPRGYIDGLETQQDTDSDHDIEISEGICRDGDDSHTLTLTSALTKRIDASWAVGDNNGGLDTGTVSDNTWYHIWLIKRTDTGVVDALFSTSATSPTMPSNYDKKRRIGAVLTDGSSNIIDYSQEGDYFLWNVAIGDLSTPNPGTSAQEPVLSVPTGIKVWADITVHLQDSSPATDTVLLLTAMDQTDVAASVSNRSLRIMDNGGTKAHTSLRCLLRTNTSAQIRIRLDNSDGGINNSVLCNGWQDSRGRNA